jgi:hypothetical protein
MRATLTVLLLAWSALGCSASEDANHSIRCDGNTPCPQQTVCYRNFCIPDEGLPTLDVDAASVSVEPSETDGRVRQVPERPGTTSDASTPTKLDANVDDAAPIAPVDNAEVDAQSGPVTEPPPVEMPPPVTPPEQGPPTPEPGVDAGPVVVDAGRNNTAANRALLAVCLPSCGSRSPACFACLSGVLSRNPEVCSEAEGVDELVSSLCDFLCTSAACRGSR